MSFRIYTKTGDKGTTALIGGTRVGKDNIRIEAYGTVDELNSQIGVISTSIENHLITDDLKIIQDLLFTIGSMLATDPDKDSKMQLPSLEERDVTFLEAKIDEMDSVLPALKSFVLPGGHIAAAHAHVARCVCRRAERICVHMANTNEAFPALVLRYLNRLSDYLFQLSRYILHLHKIADVTWEPRKS